MSIDLIIKINNDPMQKRFLRENSYWYKYLNRSSTYYKDFLNDMKNKFKIKGLDCANCAAKLENEIQKVEGVNEASISFMTERLIIECEENKKREVMDKVKKVIKKEEPDVTIEEI